MALVLRVSRQRPLGDVDIGAAGSLEGVKRAGHSQRCCKEIRREWCWGSVGGAGEGWGRNQQKKRRISVLNG